MRDSRLIVALILAVVAFVQEGGYWLGHHYRPGPSLSIASVAAAVALVCWRLLEDADKRGDRNTEIRR